MQQDIDIELHTPTVSAIVKTGLVICNDYPNAILRRCEFLLKNIYFCIVNFAVRDELVLVVGFCRLI